MYSPRTLWTSGNHIKGPSTDEISRAPRTHVVLHLTHVHLVYAHVGVCTPPHTSECILFDIWGRHEWL